MLNPVLQTTPKQVLVFDRGDGSLQVYNSFDQVFALELEEPIINASLNDSGALIVAHKAGRIQVPADSVRHRLQRAL